MKKEKINFAIDAAAFAAFVLLASTGVLMSYVLPPGSGHFSTLWGMDRHEWGKLHFWVAIALMVFLGLHLLLHWRWIVCMIKGRPREGSGLRAALSIVAVTSLLGLAALPFWGTVEQTGGEPPHKMRSSIQDNSDSSGIDGSMTLADVEKLTGIPASVLLRELGMPSNVSTDVSLGKLRKKYRFEISDVRAIVRKQSGSAEKGY